MSPGYPALGGGYVARMVDDDNGGFGPWDD